MHHCLESLHCHPWPHGPAHHIAAAGLLAIVWTAAHAQKIQHPRSLLALIFQRHDLE